MTDNLGAVARGTIGPDRSSPLAARVVALGVSGASAVEFLQQNTASLLGDALLQGRTSAVTSNVQLMAQVLTQASNPCAQVVCGSRGFCAGGVCVCDPASGFTGPGCQVPPDAVVSEWGAFGACSVSCGGGVRSRTRQCTPARCGVGCREPEGWEKGGDSWEGCVSVYVWGGGGVALWVVF